MSFFDDWTMQINWKFFVVTAFVVAAYHLVLKKWNYFTQRHVPFVRGWPLLGSLYESFLGRKSFHEVMKDYYDRFDGHRFYGIYELMIPIYVVRDPELIKQLTIQDFDHFVNHQGNFEAEGDSMIARSLFFSRNQQWKDMRSILSPAFTGNKMRMMFELVRDSTMTFRGILHDEIVGSTTVTTATATAANGKIYELKDLFSRYACNVIASSAFGLEVDAITNRDDEFYLAGKEVTNFDGWQGIKFLLYDSVPALMKLFRIKFLSPKLINYFRHVVMSAIRYREKNSVFRPDMIELLMQARKGTLDESTHSSKVNKDWHDDDVTAQCVIFFFAGFETMSTLLCFMAYELACNPDIQQKLYDEINDVHQELAGAPLTYESVQKMRYMDMVVSETLRRWPPITGSDRQVTKPYRMTNTDGTVVELTTDDAIWYAIYGIHTDAKYWPEPEKFDPERFNDENRRNIKPCTYLPFGNGQRACIASRYAMMVAKTMFCILLNEFRIETCDKTPIPLKLKANTINLMADGGFWLQLTPRNA